MLAVIVLFTGLSGMIITYGLDSYQQYIRHQHDIALQSARGVAIQIHDYLDKSRQRIDLFTRQKRELLQSLVKHPDDDATYDRFVNQLKQFFPDSVSFVITGPNGEPLVDDFENPVGTVCRNDAKQFILNNFKRDIYMHPQSNAYHFDVMSPWKDDSNKLHVLLAALSVQPLIDIFNRNVLPRFEQSLVLRGTDNLIELNARGSRPADPGLRRLPDEIADRTIARLDIPDTRWTLYTLANTELGQELAIRKAWQSAGLILVIGISLFAGFRKIDAEIRARLQAQHELEEQHKNLEQTVATRTAELELSNRELEAFSYSIAHDLRSPLRAIDGFSLLLQEDYQDKLDEEANDHIRRVRAASQRMADLIDDLLKLAKISQQPLKRSSLEISAVAESFIDQLKDRYPDQIIEFETEPGLKVQADPNLLNLILDNLLDNAVKYSRHSPVSRIRLSSRQSGDERIFCVSDNGIGLEAAYIDKLFKPFQRLHNIEEFEGNGIGLAMVARAVQRHGGRAWAEAGEQGASFCFTLSGAKVSVE